MADQPDNQKHQGSDNSNDLDIELYESAPPAAGEEAEQILEVTLEDDGEELPALAPLDAAVAESGAPWVDVPAVCAQSGQPFVVRFQEREPGKYTVVGAQPQPRGGGQPATGMAEAVKGQFSLKEYPGCPVCGTLGLIECDHCHTVTCGHSVRETKQGLVSQCPNCGRDGQLAPSGAAVIVPTQPRGKKGKV